MNVSDAQAPPVLLVSPRASGHTLDHVGTLPRQLLRYIGERLGLPTPSIALPYMLFPRDYFSNVASRRELQTMLNRGESVHPLQRAIYTRTVAPSEVHVAMKWLPYRVH
ncbi:Tn3 family transposase [Burkholderia sp. BCC1999]|uniref:Tn3 family transposase n=1 Tax=Burkholderia sp. BCC1999 TaxID=2817448 RepID=UPI002AC314F3|nr:Tn3 family transposase [Burkholderia sp. BCC1999]